MCRLQVEAPVNQNQPQRPESVQQGHKYLLNGSPVVAMNSGTLVRVLHYRPSQPWYGHVESNVQASQLLTQPMKYFHGEIPK
jgi:hypothetical protein